ncbi:helix-turn-helix domain-containing protein [Kitasatospora sp. GAS204B]|uniref:helix-turn-helix domain-containing protein n=1 Tax=unclassified Kitasatospora TaxID=2633591 RepID=UPI00247412FC|nr:helix-turn-helix domain-containing protein [Kitasatospora sp. GAS204B]MDH6117021.1 transcriptional regulator with XRE-family HTH domain [Kitasatospora sp. GAS204B]
MATVPVIPQRHQIAQLLPAIGSRLRVLRQEAGLTLDQVAALTGIGASTLSRLEAGHRQPSLDLLVPLAAVYQTPVEELVAVVEHAGEPPVVHSPQRRRGIAAQRLSHHTGGIQVYRLVLPPHEKPDQRRHDGYAWMCVLAGQVQLLLAGTRLTLGPGDAAELDTRTPHWFGAAGGAPAEVLYLAGADGLRVRLQARATSRPPEPFPPRSTSASTTQPQPS